MIVIFHIDDYRVVYYTIIMAVYFTDIIYKALSQTGSKRIIIWYTLALSFTITIYND